MSENDRQAIQTVMGALITDLRTRFAYFFTGDQRDPNTDITPTPPLEFNQETKSPMWVLTDETLSQARWDSNAVLDLEPDLEAGTVQEVNEPCYRDIEFVLTPVS